MLSMMIAMQVANIELFINGSPLHTVSKRVTPPEAVLLNHIHGVGSVAQLQLDGTVKRGNQEERDRLLSIYGEKNLLKVFPGFNHPLPTTFKEAGFVSD
jgi:hypothetical protein